jgi:hypothetical protein
MTLRKNDKNISDNEPRLLPTGRVFSISLIALAVFLIIPNPTSGTRVGREGDTWLKWSKDVRLTYGSAYVIAFTAGFNKGCEEGTNGVRPANSGLENEPLLKCLDKGPHFPTNVPIAELVTDYYKHFPDDRDLYIAEVIEGLGRGMTPAEIHIHRPHELPGQWH